MKSAKRARRKVPSNMILRAVASSTAVETGAEVKEIEKRLQENKQKYAHLALAT